MAARLALSSTSVHGQYIGTTRVTPPTAVPGSTSARRFDAGTRLLLGRSSDLGENFMVLMTFWRSSSLQVGDDQTAARLFTQYSVGGTRVAVGINRSFLSITYRSSNGTLQTVESRISLLNTDKQVLAMVVNFSGIALYLNGRVALRVTATLAAPDTSPVIVGADVTTRQFLGTIDDLAIYQVVPSRTDNWLRYYDGLANNAYVRDYVAATFSEGFEEVTLVDDSRSAVGGKALSRLSAAAPFNNAAALGTQVVEFRFTDSPDGDSGLRIGVMTPNHSLATEQIGQGENSFAYTQNGTLLRGGVTQVTEIQTWSQTDLMALAYTPATRTLALWKNGLPIHSFILPEGEVWTPALTLGKRQVDLNSGQSVPYSIGLPSKIGLYSKVWSKLTTEFRHMKVAEVAAPLDDLGTQMVNAVNNAVVGEYLGTPELAGSITPDPFDVSRKVGGKVRLAFGDYTAAGQDFFFALAFRPSEEDLAGEKILLDCPDRWGIKLLDGRLFCWVGSVQVGSINVAFTAGETYLIGITRSGSGRLLVWCHVGYLLQSGESTPILGSSDVWVGSKADGSAALTGSFSHLIAGTKKPAPWKLDRLKFVYQWDTPEIEGLIPAVAATRRVFEASYRDVVAFGVNSTPPTTDCYVMAMAAKPDDVAVEYRLTERMAGAPFIGEYIGTFAVVSTLTTAMSRTGTLITMPNGTDLSQVAVGGAVLIDNEICRVTLVDAAAGTVSVARACVDTVPAEHGVGSVVWFYSSKAFFTRVPHARNDQVDVKLLTRGELTEIGEDMVPIDTVNMLGRLARPYPAAGLTINGEAAPEVLHGTVQIAWKIRNKAVQGSALRAWNESDVAVPAGVTVVIRAYDTATNTLIHESSEVPYAERSYNLFVEFTGRMHVTVTTYQNFLPCWQIPDFTFDYTSEATVLITTEDDEPLDTEDEQNITAETLTAMRAASYDGELPDDFDGVEEEEEEEDSIGTTADGAGSVIIGVKISELPELPNGVTGAELIPVVRDGQNYWVRPEELYQYIESTLPPPVDGKDAYQIAVEEGFIGSRSAWLASLEGPMGPSSNASRRILTISSASGAVLCNWNQYDEIRLRLVGDITLTFTGARDGQGCLLKIQQDAIGGRIATLPPNVRYNMLIQSYQPSPVPGMVDKVGFIYDSAESFYDLVSMVPGISA